MSHLGSLFLPRELKVFFNFTFTPRRDDGATRTCPALSFRGTVKMIVSVFYDL